MTLLEKLREPKIAGMAILDITMTIIAGNFLAQKMKWDKKKTIPAMFVAGYLAHNITGTETPLNKYINSTFSVRPENGITPQDLPINNSTDPVKLNEIRFSTF